MLTPVSLYCELVLRSIKIKDVAVDRKLSSEFYTIELTVSKYRPKLSFCVSLILAEFSAYR